MSTLTDGRNLQKRTKWWASKNERSLVLFVIDTSDATAQDITVRLVLDAILRGLIFNQQVLWHTHKALIH